MLYAAYTPRDGEPLTPRAERVREAGRGRNERRRAKGEQGRKGGRGEGRGRGGGTYHSKDDFMASATRALWPLQFRGCMACGLRL